MDGEPLLREMGNDGTRRRSMCQLAVEAVVRTFSNNPRCEEMRASIGMLPLHLKLNVLGEMCDYPSLVAVQLDLLTDPLLVSDFISEFATDLTPLVQCFQWLQSVKQSLAMQLFHRYRTLLAEKSRTAGGLPRLDYRCGLRIGTFLTQTGWYVEAIGMLNLTTQQTRLGSPEELAVLRQLMCAQVLAGRLKHAQQTGQRVDKLNMSLLHGRPLHNLRAGIMHSFSLFYFEDINFTCSYNHTVQSLAFLSERSPPRLIIDVFRQAARASLGRRFYAKAAFMLQQAMARVARVYGRTSAPYAELLEDLAIQLLARNQVTDSVNTFADAHHIYTQLYGARNLLLSTGQGNLAYGLCLQAYVTGRHDRALQHVAKAIANYRRTLPPDHRMLVQVGRLRATIALFHFRRRSPVEQLDVAAFLQQIAQPMPLRVAWNYFMALEN
uniref:Anaphase-promoting complex subunit 5 n=1 Tax=Anopheles farauti TaxID=69004 RepID=A0A182Q5I7_9DIPT